MDNIALQLLIIVMMLASGVKHGVNANAIFIREAPVWVAALTAGATFNG